jgi:hypothetical protein
VYDQVIADAKLVNSSAKEKPFSENQFFCKVDLASYGIKVTRGDGMELI